MALTVLGSGESSRLHNRLVRRDQTAVAAGFGMARLAGAAATGGGPRRGRVRRRRPGWPGPAGRAASAPPRTS
ncbi:hypothetical protein DRB89_40690 [Streptomyces sp. ICC4]|nr:hypothetical protein DRB89_40690 [Streptomyces sp. ICC4]